MHIGWLFIAGALLLPAPALAGSLKDVDAAARGRGSQSEDRDHDASPGGSRDEGQSGDLSSSDDGDGASVWGLIFLFPWMLPHALADDPCVNGFAAHPYEREVGNMRRLPGPLCPAPAEAFAGAPYRFAAQVAFEGGYVLERIAAGTFAARLQMPWRFELEGRLSLNQDLAAVPHEQALTGTSHLSLRFAQLERVQFRSGVGLRAFSLRGPLFGFDFLYGIDLYAPRPLVFHIELHLGHLARAFAAQARATVGVQVWKLELYAGYDHTAFSGGARLSGPVLGVRASL